jgi:hypothetical protein
MVLPDTSDPPEHCHLQTSQRQPGRQTLPAKAISPDNRKTFWAPIKNSPKELTPAVPLFPKS